MSDEPLLHILFVDDEPNILRGLKRMLYGERGHWDMHFACGADEAIEKLKEIKFDLIVSDMRMPKGDGIYLLNYVKDNYPEITRFILSGYSDREMVLRSIGPTHRFLTKPCDPEVLKEEIRQSFALKQQIKNPAIINLIKSASEIPTLPELFQKLSAELKSDQANTESISQIISQDLAMSAKILHLVNSSFFGMKRDISSITQAVSLLGLETISNIVLTAGVMNTFSANQVAEFHLKQLYEHSIEVGGLAPKIMKALGGNKKQCEQATLAGLTHDFGILLLITAGNEPWQELYKKHWDSPELSELEADLIGTTHAHVGAYLLSLWGVCDQVVEALAFHHHPADAITPEINITIAVYLANQFTFQRLSATNDLVIDWPYLEQIGVEEHIVQNLYNQYCEEVGS